MESSNEQVAATCITDGSSAEHNVQHEHKVKGDSNDGVLDISQTKTMDAANNLADQPVSEGHDLNEKETLNTSCGTDFGKEKCTVDIPLIPSESEANTITVSSAPNDDGCVLTGLMDSHQPGGVSILKESCSVQGVTCNKTDEETEGSDEFKNDLSSSFKENVCSSSINEVPNVRALASNEDELPPGQVCDVKNVDDASPRESDSLPGDDRKLCLHTAVIGKDSCSELPKDVEMDSNTSFIASASGCMEEKIEGEDGSTSEECHRATQEGNSLVEHDCSAQFTKKRVNTDTADSHVDRGMPMNGGEVSAMELNDSAKKTTNLRESCDIDGVPGVQDAKDDHRGSDHDDVTYMPVQLDHEQGDSQKKCKQSSSTGILMRYRGNDAELHESDTSTDSSADESSSDASDIPNRCTVRDGNDEDGDADEEEEVQDGDGRKSKSSWPRSLPRTKGEICFDDLPPIEELTITVGDDVKMVEVGEIKSAVHTLVIVQAKPGLPPLNEDTILFLKDKKVLGQVFETFGPVAAPLYSIRFNSPDQIRERDLNAGLLVYYAPDAEEYTHYVFMAHLQSIKASDASWEHNNEPPPQCIDYSDDEEERRAKGQLKQERRHKAQHDGDTVNICGGKKSKRRVKDDGGFQKSTSGSMDNKWPSRDHQSWPPKDKMQHHNNSNIMPSPNGYQSTPGRGNTGSYDDNYGHADRGRNMRRGSGLNAPNFMWPQSQGMFGRGKHMKRPPHPGVSSSGPPPRSVSPCTGSCTGISSTGPPPPPPGVFSPGPAPPGVSFSSGVFPPPSSIAHMMQRPPPSHMNMPRGHSVGNFAPQSFPAGLPTHSMPQNSQFRPPQHSTHGQPPLQHQPPGQFFPTSSDSVARPCFQNNTNMRPSRYTRPPRTSHTRPSIMGNPYTGSHSSCPQFSRPPPYAEPAHLAVQQFGGQPHFPSGPINSPTTKWGDNSYHQQ